MKARRYRKFDNKKLGMLRLGKEFAVLVILAVIVFGFVLGLSRVSGRSMYPTFNDGQIVAYSRLHRTYEKGDVISLRMPNGEYMIKRVAAVAGDEIDIRDGAFWVNGAAEQGSYVNGSTQPQESSIVYPLLLKEGQIFVLGDNREVSIDSRTYGPVSLTQTRGRILGDK